MQKLYFNVLFFNSNKRRQIDFVLGSIFSAIMGVGFNLYGIRLKEDENFGKLHHAALAIASLASPILFEIGKSKSYFKMSLLDGTILNHREYTYCSP